ncbi:hypothetical protein L810_8186 [Burkholderia sp. AU4i]|nr:hypothetical protein L810_8186 [Burkholderia sp. AU4i]MDW9245729.1 hypothetical protein [Burkholderia cepacia]QOH36501.1 hypothetical protein C7S14_7751 [Burkholderia cepacia]
MCIAGHPFAPPVMLAVRILKDGARLCRRPFGPVKRGV